MLKQIELIVNGEIYSLDVKPNHTLLDVLRNHLNLTGAKYGCGTGDCGVCTVLVNGKPVSSCLTLAVAMEGRVVTTIEGLSQNGKMHPVQEEFVRHGAIQCGYCTPGFVLIAKALLDEQPEPTREEIRKYVKGNLCRCTGYVKIIDAISAAAQRLKNNQEVSS